MSNQSVRAKYETAVAELANAAALKLESGASEEDVARWVVAERDAIKKTYRARTPEPILARIVARTVARYGNEMGPSVEDLRAAGKSWRDIIDSATRAGAHGDDLFRGGQRMHALPEAVASQVSAARAVLERHLGDNLRAIHLFGSAIDAGLKPCSDVDLMVSVASPLAESVRQGLMRELLLHSAWPGSSRDLRALEVTVVALGELVPWRYPPRREMQFGEWLREDIEAGRYEPAMQDPDLAILITKLRRHGVVVSGPPAEALFEEVPAAHLTQALAHTISQWNEEADWRGEERNIILALARIWYTACTGEIASKDRAAAWAAARLPAEHRALMENAAKAYLDGSEDGLAAMPGRVARTIHFCKGEIERELQGPASSTDSPAP